MTMENKVARIKDFKFYNEFQSLIVCAKKRYNVLKLLRHVRQTWKKTDDTYTRRKMMFI